MRILITNDDGYNAAGLVELVKRLKDEHELYVVAPENEMSASSHAVNFFKGVSCRPVEIIGGVQGYAVGGTPADCVLMAVKMLFKDVVFDLVLSGINSVLNLGTDIMYSGTFSAAREATFQRIKGVAVSVCYKKSGTYAYAADFIASNLERLKALAVENVTVNVNVPSDASAIKGVKVCEVLYQPYDEIYDVIEGQNGEVLYSVHGTPYPQPEGAVGDCAYFSRGYVTVSPVEMISSSKSVVASADEGAFVI